MKLTEPQREALESVILAGSVCSGLLYNFAQRLPTQHDQGTCKEAFENWDKALTVLKVEMKKGSQ